MKSRVALAQARFLSVGVVLFLVVGGLLGLAGNAESLAAGRPATAAAIRACGEASQDIGVAANRVTCTKARAVARAYLRGNHRPFGYRCKRIAVQAAAGFYTHCTLRAAVVNIIPE